MDVPFGWQKGDELGSAEGMKGKMGSREERILNNLGTTRSGMQPNVAAALAYVFTVVTGPIILIIERKNRYVRFHALQAILFGVVWIALWITFGVIVNRIWPVTSPMWLLDALLHFIIMLGGLVTIVFLMHRSYKGEKVRLPVLGSIADKLA